MRNRRAELVASGAPRGAASATELELASGTKLLSFQPAMARLAEQVAGVDLRRFETLPAAKVHAELPGIALAQVTEARAIVASILEACENQRSSLPPLAEAATLGDTGDFERALDAAVASLGAVEDVAFLVQLELRQREQRVRLLGEGSSVLTIVAECDGALRRIRKGLGAIDIAIARAELGSPALDFSSELQDSLRVREAYAKFRSRLLGEAGNEIYPRMRAAGTQIAMLVGWSAYPLLRVRDRLQLRELQQRILTWLRPENRGHGTAGERIWQDVVAFVEMLVQVNRRQELVEHDSVVVTAVLERFREGEPPRDGDWPAPLRSLVGLDDELDRLIASGPPAAEPLRLVLERLADRLGAMRQGGT
jgi:hypothetical protein